LNTCKRHRFRPEVIFHAGYLYYQFNLSYRLGAGPFFEDLLVEQDIIVSQEPNGVDLVLESLLGVSQGWGSGCLYE